MLYMVLGDAVSTLDTFLLIGIMFQGPQPGLYPKSSKLGQMTMLSQVIDWLNFETRSSSLCNFAMASCEKDALKKILSDFNGIEIRDRWSPLTNKDFKMYETGNGDGNGKEQ